MKKITSLRLRNLLRNTGLLKFGLVILAGLTVNVGKAQTSFATAYNLNLTGGAYGSVTTNNTGVSRDAKAPNIAGFAAHAPLWYKWTPSVDGEMELDTIGSVGFVYVTNIVIIKGVTNNVIITNSIPLDTVLGVFTGTSLSNLNQVAANDDLFPINSTIPNPNLGLTEGFNVTGSADYGWAAGPGTEPAYDYLQPYYGPSHLRFNATSGTTYYIAVDSHIGYGLFGSPRGNGLGICILTWAYKSSGVFRFATEDVDLTTGLPLYQAAETESDYQVKYVPVGNAVLHTYYSYNVPGVLVTVTRVAGSTGRATVFYQTLDGASLTNSITNSIGSLPYNDVGAVAGVDYIGVTNTLIFDDYEMSKTILIPIVDPTRTNSYGSGGYMNNTVFGVQLSTPQLDPGEDSGAVSPARVDPNFSLALVKILNVNADPYGPDTIQVISTNVNNPWLDPPTNTIPNLVTNYPIVMPTNPIVSFQKCNFRVPEDVNDPANPNGYTTPVTIYVRRSPMATNHSAITLHYRVNNFINDDFDSDEEWNNWFPLQPASDYAVPTPPNYATALGTNSDFNMVQGTITFPDSGPDEALMPVTFTVTNSTLTKFNRDFKIQLYEEITVKSRTVPALVGMVAEATVTILFNDQHPPAGSVDELYNADFNRDLALAVQPQTTPPKDATPGVSGVVNSVLVLTNNEALIGGYFFVLQRLQLPRRQTHGQHRARGHQRRA